MGNRGDRRSRVLEEVELISLGDPRREKRAKTIAGRLAFHPDASLPVAMGDEAMLEGAYRHLSSPHVSLDELLLPHVARTAERVNALSEAYAIHDTSGFTFGGAVRREGLGHVQSDSDQGFRAHVTLAAKTDGSREPLGLLAVGTRSRPAKKEENHSEGDRWETGIRVAESHAGAGKLIHVGDRESDMFTLLAAARENGWRFIIRAAQDRALATELVGEVDRLFTAARMRIPRLTAKVFLSPRGTKRPGQMLKTHPARAGRHAELHMSAVTARLRRPGKAAVADTPEAVPVNVIRVWEPKPPKGQAPVEWLLVTSEPIDTPDAIRAVVDGYRTRWIIEEYFCALKTGCAFESKQLETSHALLNMFAYCLIVAYVLLLMRTLARSKRKIAATEVFTEAQLRCLKALSPRQFAPRPSAREALLQVAALGGHLRQNGDPGWRTLSRGWSRLLDAEAIYLLMNQRQRSDQS